MKLQLLHQTKVRNGLIKSYLVRKPLVKLQLLHQTKVSNGLIKSYLVCKPLVKLQLLHRWPFPQQRGQRVDRSTRRRSGGHHAGYTGLPMEHVQHARKLGQLEPRPTRVLLETMVCSSQLPRQSEVAS